ncbi:MAG: alpha/beta fold hydrolase [Bryobacterales bacterium]|nr:alpha/beta fold hydrolase [Bryobacterales bacterium]
MNAGLRMLRHPVPMLLAYPAEAPQSSATFGPYTIGAAHDAPIAPPHPCPLILISHGTGSSHLVHRNLALHLARNGYIVLVPEHPRNNRNDNSLANTNENLADRPRLLSQLIDWALADPTLAPHIAPQHIAIVGHSLGGYTALATAGGRPANIDVSSDPRVKALVLLAPATPWFLPPGSLADVRVPILMLTAEKDPHTPEGHGIIVKRGLPPQTPIEHNVIPNAGHFSFLSPFPPAMATPAFAPAHDPPGFNREHFQHEMFSTIDAFLQRAFNR